MSTTRNRHLGRFAASVLIALVVLAATTACQPTKVAISASLSPSGTVAVGSTVVASGKVTPARSSGTVVVDRLMDGKWVERARGTLSSSSTYRITLKPSERTTYTLRVRRLATGNDIEASTSRLTLVTATPPNAPSALTASVSGTMAQVSWAAPDGNGAPIDHYLLRLDGGGQQNCATTTCAINGLAAGTTHSIVVAAVNQIGTSPWSATHAFTMPSGTVTISKGAAVSMPDCQSGCRRIVVSLSGFSGGSHQVSCWDSAGGWASFYSYTTSQTSTDSCYYGYPGTQVYVVVDGVQSNTITW